MLERPPHSSPFPYTTLFRSITESASRLGVMMRAGLHTGECEMEGLPGDVPSGVKVRGIAPLVGAHVANRAAAREVLVSDRKSTRLNSSHSQISYAVFCLKKK